jgi:hypothetical protein
MLSAANSPIVVEGRLVRTCEHMLQTVFWGVASMPT